MLTDFSMVDTLFSTKTVENPQFWGQMHLSKEKMIEFTVYVRKEGRITVPREIRAALNIEEGNLVKCKIEKLAIR